MKKRKLNFQKLFCLISFIFLLTCVIFYGARLIYFYKESHSTETSSDTSLAETILEKNKSNLKKVDNDYYFYNDSKNNYITYSNITWRILKITETNNLVLVSDSPVTLLSYSADNFKESDIYNYLNNNLYKKLNNTDKYLTTTTTCTDTIDDIDKYTCSDKEESSIGILSLYDYITAGSTKSYLNNKYYNYLSNNDKDNEIWYINDEGKVSTTDTDELYGVKATITLSAALTLKDGDGTSKNPYTFESENSYLAAYVKLDNDKWRIYDYSDTEVKLVQTTLLDYKGLYSKSNYYHNDTVSTSLAYYLNHTYYNSLNYSSKINESKYNNYYYTGDYEIFSKHQIDTKVSIPSISDLYLTKLDNYFTNTGTTSSGTKLYVINENGTTSNVSTTTEKNILPCITINKDLLTKGNGTKDEPYEME